MLYFLAIQVGFSTAWYAAGKYASGHCCGILSKVRLRLSDSVRSDLTLILIYAGILASTLKFRSVLYWNSLIALFNIL